jgi:antitoxin CptB
MREMDILLQGYLEAHYDDAPESEQQAFEALLDEADLDILSWIMHKTQPDENYVNIINVIRQFAEHAKLNAKQ